jgi:alpha-D-xyloside xylohydrolase
MKFTHGIWEDRRDTVIYSATEVAHVSQLAPDRISVLCATRHVAHRGNTLNRPTITLTVSAAAPGIIACAATHFKGAKKASEPRFEIFPGGNQRHEFSHVRSDGDAGLSVFSSGDLQAELDRTPSNFRLNFQSSPEGKPLTSVGYQGVQYIVGPPNQGVPTPLEASTKIADPYHRPGLETNAKPYMSVAFDLQVGELVYGLGERFGPLTKNGQSIELWNEDAGTCTMYS